MAEVVKKNYNNIALISDPKFSISIFIRALILA
jgi:hypothetical protein